MNYVVWGLQNVSTKEMVQEQDSCLKSHLPPECKRCIRAVFHSAAFAGYWQKPPTNKLSVHKSQLLDFQNESSHLPFFVSFLLVTNVYRTHPCHFKLYFSLYYIWQCTFLGPRGPLVLPSVGPSRPSCPVCAKNLDHLYTGIYAL